MLTRLHFKNWRSLKDVTIDNLTPLTVFIGANSSGKTNIVDGLDFMIKMMSGDPTPAVRANRGNKTRTLNTDDEDALVFSATYLDPVSKKHLTYEMNLKIETAKDLPTYFHSHLCEGEKRLFTQTIDKFPILVFGISRWREASWADEGHFIEGIDQHEAEHLLRRTKIFVQERWQILGEGFLPKLAVTFAELGAIYPIQNNGANLVAILDYMRDAHPNIFTLFQQDIAWMLNHIEHVDINLIKDQEARFSIFENAHPSIEAPTISAGTAHIAAMLAAYYAFDFKNQELPGLVIIEEPDTALNPGLLEKFVELLRDYVSDPEKPRQFIMTTHNPAFLDFFQPEEVRVVSRDEQGYTHVDPIPEHIKEVWLDKYGLGEVWMTRAFGGLPE